MNASFSAPSLREVAAAWLIALLLALAIAAVGAVGAPPEPSGARADAPLLLSRWGVHRVVDEDGRADEREGLADPADRDEPDAATLRN